MSLLHSFSGFAPVALLALTIAVHVIIAVGVYRDASERFHRRENLFMFPPLAWSAIALLTGLLGLTFYWLAHHSTLAKEK